ncbi:hypothetical protein OESDEN_18357 [Oesophagostomum dentatum]|uniref:Uncharacterized protein n=1 Tax=Oesophagostomum dentatum TaxID=61180 RepID=A0A0B1S9G7_OESDE|nr:hypothetical protein OESDEN_18357 [Oesophagostomum dentatum]
MYLLAIEEALVTNWPALSRSCSNLGVTRFSLMWISSTPASSTHPS